MSDLADFLLARIADDEVAARSCAEVYPSPWDCSDRGWVAYVTADAPHFREVVRLDQEHLAREEQPEWLGEPLAHIARWDPARVLAECEAKRRIVTAESGRWSTRADAPIAEMRTDSWSNRVTVHFDTGGEETMTSAEFRDRYQEPFLSDTLRFLAQPYADHPDYREEWRP